MDSNNSQKANNKTKNDRLSKAKQTFQQLKLKKATTSSLLTFRRKFKLSKNKRSRSKSCHHFRTLLSTWRRGDIESLHRHYQLLSLHKALSNAADRAKPAANSVIFDLYELHQSGLFSDFQVFSNHLDQITESNGLLSPRATSNKSEDESTSFNRSRNPSGSQQPITSGKDVWIKKMSFPYMSEAAFKFIADLHKLMLSAAKNGDLRLRFTSSSPTSSHQSSSCDIYCHSFLLASRSTYFRKLLKSKWKRINDEKNETSGKFLLLELDSKIFASRYFRVVLNVMYTDQIDLSPLTSSKSTSSTAGDVTTSSTSTSSAASHQQQEARDTSNFHARVQDYIQLHQIATFIDFPLLVQGCEKGLLDLVTPTNLPLLLDWSSKPHGSIWLRRQLISYAAEHFLQLSHTDTFNFLDQNDLEEIIQSDLVNSPELDIFQVVMRWGEEKVLRRVDIQDMLRTPRSIFYRPSSSHRNVKSRNSILNTYMKRLKEHVEPLLVHIRFRHILPLNHQVVTTAIKRKIIHRPIYRHHPLDLYPVVAGGSKVKEAHPICPFANMDVTYWLREFDDSPDFRPPRLYQAFFDEIKIVLSEETSSAAAQQTTTTTTKLPTTSALNNSKKGDNNNSGDSDDIHTAILHHASSSRCHRFSSLNVVSMATTRLKYVHCQFPVCSTQMACKMLHRERLLRHKAWVRHILNVCYASNLSQSHCPCTTRDHPNSAGPSGQQPWKEITNSQIQNKLCHLCRAETYLRLLVVREHGLHDAMTDIVRRPHLYYDPDELYDAQQENNMKEVAPLVVRRQFATAHLINPQGGALMTSSASSSTSSSSSTCSVDSVIENKAMTSSSLVPPTTTDNVDERPGGVLLLRHDDISDDDVTRSRSSVNNVPDVASTTTTSRLKVDSGQQQQQQQESIFHRGRTSASVYARNLLHRGPKLRMVELLLCDNNNDDVTTAVDDDNARTKSLPNFRTSIGGGKELPTPPPPALPQQLDISTQTMPQLLLDGQTLQRHRPEILPDLYACNSLPRITMATTTMMTSKPPRRSSDSTAATGL